MKRIEKNGTKQDKMKMAEEEKKKMVMNTDVEEKNAKKKRETNDKLKREKSIKMRSNIHNVAKKVKKESKRKKEKCEKLKNKGIRKKELINMKEKKDETKGIILGKNIKNGDDKLPTVTNLIDVECLWTDLFISKPLLKCLFELKLDHPTLIQKDVIPLALEGKSILANSETGSGKTLAFVLPILERLLQSPNIRMRAANAQSMTVTKSLILLPTRELALQCYDVVKSMTKYVPITYSLFCGGLDIKQQETEYKKKNDIFICTPGRILDLLLNYSNDFINFLEVVVFDEADKLLELGFKEECLKVLEVCKFKKQILFFSATLTKDIKDLVNFSLKNPIFIQSGQNNRSSVDSENDNHNNNNNNKKNSTTTTNNNSNKILKSFKIAENLNQEFVNITQEKFRKSVLLYLCSNVFKNHTIIFFNTRKEAHYLYLILTFLKFKCAELHGGLSQKKRIESICQFKKQEVNFLLTTDLASRGIDIDHIRYVINYNSPSNVIKYVHRIGRTARIGKEGTSCTLYLPSEKEHVKKMIKSLKKNKSCTILKRSVAKEHVLQWDNVLKKNKNAIKNIVEQEITEREIQKSEKYIDKIKNIILYKDEIMSRPQKTWFLTAAEKKQLRKEALKREHSLAEICEKENVSEKEASIKRSRKSDIYATKKKSMKNMKKQESCKQKEKQKHNSSYDGDGGHEKNGNGYKGADNNLKTILKQLKINVFRGKDKKCKSKLKKNEDKDCILQKKHKYELKKGIKKAKREAQQRENSWKKTRGRKKSSNIFEVRKKDKI